MLTGYSDTTKGIWNDSNTNICLATS